MRMHLRPSETTITAQNLWQLNCNWSFLGASSVLNQPLYTVPWELQICFMFAGHEVVIHIEMCAVSE